MGGDLLPSLSSWLTDHQEIIWNIPRHSPTLEEPNKRMTGSALLSRNIFSGKLEDKETLGGSALKQDRTEGMLLVVTCSSSGPTGLR